MNVRTPAAGNPESPAEAARWPRRSAPLLCLICSASYLLTMNPTIYWGDGIELTTAAAVLGNAHPTGYPLFMQLGKLLLMLPLGTLGWRMNLLSVIPAVLLAYITFRLAQLIFSALFAAQLHSAALLDGAALACAASAAFSRSLWYQAGFCEVYLLNAAGVTGLVYLALLAVLRNDRRMILAGALLSGLLLGNQLLALCGVASLTAALLLFVLHKHKDDGKKKPRRPAFGFDWKLAPACCAFGLTGLLIYAHMPIRAAAHPPLNWGDPSNWQRFAWSVRGGDFRKQRLLIDDAGSLKPFTPATWLGFCAFRAKQINNWFGGGEVFQRHETAAIPLSLPGAAGLALALFGCAVFAVRQRLLACVIAPALLLNLFLLLIYNIADIDGYFLPLLPWLSIGFCVALLQVGFYFAGQAKARSAAWVYLLLLLPAAQFAFNRQPADHSPRYFDYSPRGDRAYAAENYAREALGAAAYQALIITSGDNDIYPLWYLQQAENFRRDIDVAGSNFLVAQPWYQTYFSERFFGSTHPDDAPLHWFEFAEIPRSKIEFITNLRERFLLPNLRYRPVYLTWYEPELNLRVRQMPLRSLLNAGVLEHTPEARFFIGVRELYQIIPAEH